MHRIAVFGRCLSLPGGEQPDISPEFSGASAGPPKFIEVDSDAGKRLPRGARSWSAASDTSARLATMSGMAGNSFGQLFRITTAGESHGPGNVVIIDGVPPGLALSVDDFLVDLDRRRPGQSRIVTQRKESDRPEILSGVFEGRTTGTSLAVLIRNEDQRSRDYGEIKDKYRPGHADFCFDAKYGLRDYRGGGRSSARETTVRVAAGVVAKKLIAEAFGGGPHETSLPLAPCGIASGGTSFA